MLSGAAVVLLVLCKMWGGVVYPGLGPGCTVPRTGTMWWPRAMLSVQCYLQVVSPGKDWALDNEITSEEWGGQIRLLLYVNTLFQLSDEDECQNTFTYHIPTRFIFLVLQPPGQIPVWSNQKNSTSVLLDIYLLHLLRAQSGVPGD